jgi:hypothetical protein
VLRGVRGRDECADRHHLQHRREHGQRRARRGRAWPGGEQAGEGDGQDEGQNEVGPEDGAPAQRRGHDPADDEAEPPGKTPARVPRAERPFPGGVGFGEAGEQDQRVGHGDRGRDPLHTPGGDERHDVRRECRRHRPGREEDEPAQQEAAVAVPVPEAGRDQQQAGEPDRVDRDHEPGLCRAATEFVQHFRQRRDDHRHTHHVDQLDRAQCREGRVESVHPLDGRVMVL